MRIAPLADVKARLSAYLDECGAQGPLVITRNGKAVAVLLIPYDDDDLERLMLERSPRFQSLLNRSRQSIKNGQGLSEADFGHPVVVEVDCRLSLRESSVRNPQSGRVDERRASDRLCRVSWSDWQSLPELRAGVNMQCVSLP
jgi:prevent-host-death family protein